MPSTATRAISPPTSTTFSAHGNTSPLHIKKVVIEGRSKHDGVSLKMYLKFSVAVDNVSPGASIFLFREDNLRITQSKVHPLDENSVPYYYSSTEQPLLHRAAFALQLGTRSSRHYHALFPMLSPHMDPTSIGSSRHNRDSAASTSTTPPTDERYTGFILVSGYSITLVLPKEFPPTIRSTRAGAGSDGDDGIIKETPSSWSTRSARRSSSMFQKTYMHMMAALEVLVPYVITPPKGPFLVSIPVPRCLDNHVKLRISTPVTHVTSSSIPRGSFTSTSSEDDNPGWDFLTDPPVTRKIDKSMRKSPYQQSADDDQSDSPSGPSIPGTELIQGAFQSTDVLHVRWAPPLGRRSGIAKTEDGMRRVSIERSVGKTKCEVLDRDSQCLKLGITYQGVCSGLWHPGVATMLGMDVAFDVKGRRVSWPDGAAGWTVSGGNGFGGLHSEASRPTGITSRRSSFDSSTSAPFLPTLVSRAATTPPRSSASLLRAPLPNQKTPEYSFESSPDPTPSPGIPLSGPSSAHPPLNTPWPEPRLSNTNLSPGKSIMLKINLLKLFPPAKNVFEFIIEGTVIIDVEEEDFVPLPTFRVLGSDKEKIDTTVALQALNTVVQIGTQVADSPRRVLQPGEEMRCEDSVGLVLGAQRLQAVIPSIATPAKQKASLHVRSHMHSPRMKARRLQEGLALSTQRPDLPCVLSTVTPLPHSQRHTHCVRVNIPAYAFEADVIEFGLVIPQQVTTFGSAATTVEVLYASYAGRYVQAEALSRQTDALSSIPSEPDTLLESREMNESQIYVVVHLEDVEVAVGEIEIVYLISEGDKEPYSDRGKGKAKEEVAMHVLLPCFQQPISRYEVKIDCPAKYDPQVLYSTLPNQHATHSKALKLTHFVMPAGFFPVLFLSLLPSSEFASEPSRTRRAVVRAWHTVPNVTAVILLYLVVSVGSEVRQVRETMNAAAQAFIGGVTYPDALWGDRTDAPNKAWWWPPGQPPVHEVSATTTVTVIPTETATASISTPTSWGNERVSMTPAVNLAEATPVHEKRPARPPQSRNIRASMALIPLPAMPLLSWQIPLSAEKKEMIVKGFWKVIHLLRRIIEFPLDPD